jgi:hypothetical protein
VVAALQKLFLPDNGTTVLNFRNSDEVLSYLGQQVRWAAILGEHLHMKGGVSSLQSGSWQLALLRGRELACGWVLAARKPGCAAGVEGPNVRRRRV